MKKLIILITFTTMSIFALAQTKDEVKVAEQTEKLRLAMISGNKSDLESLVTDQLTYGHSGGKIEDKETFVSTISTKKSDFKTIELSDQSLTVAGNTAIVRHVLKADTNDGGIPGKVNLGIVLVWEKQGDTWKLLARRAFKLRH